MPLQLRSQVIRQNQRDRAKELFQQGKTVPEIATEIGRNKSFVYKALGQIDPYKLRCLTADEREKAVSLYRQGYTSCSIGSELGLSHTTVLKAVRQASPEILANRPQKEISAEQTARIIHLYQNEYWKSTAIANEMNLPLHRIQKLIQEHRKNKGLAS